MEKIKILFVLNILNPGTGPFQRAYRLDNNKFKVTILSAYDSTEELIAKAKEYNKNKNPDHKSMGIGVTKSRIEIFNRENDTNVEVVFHDKYKNGKPEGTTVEFYLPIFD